MLIDERIKDVWSSPHVIKWVEYICNKYDIDESGTDAYTITFGTARRKQFEFPPGPLTAANATAYLKALDASLADVQSLVVKYQSDLVNKRIPDGAQNMFLPGEFVLFELPSDKPRPHKLHARYVGPYEVLTQTKNDVQVRHLSLGRVQTLYVGDLKRFRGSREAALALATTDADQHVVSAILAYRGDPLVRTSTSFLVRFADNEEIWLPWSRDLYDSEPYVNFCQSLPELKPLVSTVAAAKAWLQATNATPIPGDLPGRQAFIDIRAFGADWYQTLDLPNLHTAVYYAPCRYGKWASPRRKIKLHCETLKLTRTVDHVFVQMYGSLLTEPTSDAHMVDAALVAAYPKLCTPQVPTSSASDFEHLVGQSFWGPDDRCTYTVTRISVYKGNVVAYVAPPRAPGRPAPRELAAPFHVADVVLMLAAPPPRR